MGQAASRRKLAPRSASVVDGKRSDQAARSIPESVRSLAVAILTDLKRQQKSEVEHFVDFGCGTGDLLQLLFECAQVEISSATGVDANPHHLDQARERLVSLPRAKNLTLRCVGSDLAFESRPADLVVLSFVLNRVPVVEQRAVLQRVVAGVKEGGMVVVAEVNRTSSRRNAELRMVHGFVGHGNGHGFGYIAEHGRDPITNPNKAQHFDHFIGAGSGGADSCQDDDDPGHDDDEEEGLGLGLGQEAKPVRFLSERELREHLDAVGLKHTRMLLRFDVKNDNEVYPSIVVCGFK